MFNEVKKKYMKIILDGKQLTLYSYDNSHKL